MAQSLKVWLNQDVVPPYRIPLFQRIAATPGIDFKLILFSPGMKNLNHWNTPIEDFPFATERLDGISINLGYTGQININIRFLPKLFKEKPDVILCAGYSFATIQVYLYHLITGKPYVIWMEGTFTTEGTRHPSVEH